MSNLLHNINVGATGLRTASTGLSVTSHNVANASTEGYTRRTVSTSTYAPVSKAGLLFGQGSQVTELRRVSEKLIEDRMVTTVGEEARSSTTYQTLSSVEAYFDDEMVNGPASLLSAFYDSLNELKTDPSDSSLRRQVTSTADRLAASVNQTAGALNTAMESIQYELEDSVADVNEMLARIAELNEDVAKGGGALSAGDYADQRDQLIRQLAEDVGATVHFNPDGQATVFIGGHAVVSKGSARELVVGTDATTGGPKVTVSAGGGGTLNITSSLGGAFGGLTQAWSKADDYLSELDSWTETLANDFNAQHQAGFDANGAAGADFFTFTAGSEAMTFAVDSNLLADERLFAAAGAATAAVGDADNLDQLIALEGTRSFNGGTQTAEKALAALYARVGRDVSTLDLENRTHQAELADMVELRESISGVDLDEEAANLMAWQATYEASARVVSTTNELLGVLMDMGR